MHHQTDRLVNHAQVRILVHNIQRHGLWHIRLRHGGRLQTHGDGFGRLDQVSHLGNRYCQCIAADAGLLYQVLEVIAGKFGH